MRLCTSAFGLLAVLSACDAPAPQIPLDGRGGTGGGAGVDGGGSGQQLDSGAPDGADGAGTLATCDGLVLLGAPTGACLVGANSLLQGDPAVNGVTTLATSVTVASVNDMVSSPCGANSMFTQFVLDGLDGQQRSLYLPSSATPADLLKVGDTLDLVLDLATGLFTYTRQLFLSRNGALVLFDLDLSAIQWFPLPDQLQSQGDASRRLGSYGFVVSDDGIICRTLGTNANPCGIEGHRARVTAGADSVTMSTGETQVIAGYSISINAFYKGLSSNACDFPHRVALTGFAVVRGP